MSRRGEAHRLPGIAEDAVGDDDKGEIERAAAEALAAANAWRGEPWYEPADLELTLRFGGDEAPAVAGWRARLANVEVSGANTAVIALEMVRDGFANSAASHRAKR